MEISKALNQLAEIQDTLQRSQVYRGYRPITVGMTSILAVVAAYLGQSVSPVIFWPAVAGICLAVLGGEMAYDYSVSFSQHQRRLARKVLVQFVPAVAMAGCWTGLWIYSGNPTQLLPSLWSFAYAYCLLSARPHLPAGLGHCILFYSLAGLALATPVGSTHFHLGMGLTFGLGQLLLALILHWNLPRKEGS